MSQEQTCFPRPLLLRQHFFELFLKTGDVSERHGSGDFEFVENLQRVRGVLDFFLVLVGGVLFFQVLLLGARKVHLRVAIFFVEQNHGPLRVHVRQILGVFCFGLVVEPQTLAAPLEGLLDERHLVQVRVGLLELLFGLGGKFLST